MRTMLRTLPLVALLAPALAADSTERVRNVRAELESGNAPKLKVAAATDAPDGAILTVSVKTDRTDITGRHTKLVDSRRGTAKGGSLEVQFSFQAPLAYGAYVVEVDCDRNRQYPNVKLPDGSYKASTEFKIDFTEDAVAPALALADVLDAVRRLHEDLEAGRKEHGSQAEAYAKFHQAWSEQVSKLPEYAVSEDLLYPQTRSAIGGVVQKLNLFASLYAFESKGEKDPTKEAHPNWFEPDPSADLARARATLAKEYAFNVGKKVVDYAYDKSTELLKGSKAGAASAQRGWEVFKARFSTELDQLRAGYDKLTGGTIAQEMGAIALEVPGLVSAGQDLLTAVDQEMQGGKSGLDRVKDALKKGYTNNLKRIADAK